MIIQRKPVRRFRFQVSSRHRHPRQDAGHVLYTSDADSGRATRHKTMGPHGPGSRASQADLHPVTVKRARGKRSILAIPGNSRIRRRALRWVGEKRSSPLQGSRRVGAAITRREMAPRWREKSHQIRFLARERYLIPTSAPTARRAETSHVSRLSELHPRTPGMQSSTIHLRCRRRVSRHADIIPFPVGLFLVVCALRPCSGFQ